MARALRTDTYEEKERPPETPLSLALLHAAEPRLRGTIVPLPARLCVGREAERGVDLALDDAKVSRRHAVFTRAGDEVMLEDLDSKNGTFVGGERIIQRRRALAAGDVVRIGEALFELGEHAPPPADFVEDARLVGRSGPLRGLLAAIDRAAPTAVTVLVVGETGVGKELVAARLHEKSGRAGPLLAVNCGAVPAGLWEAALFGHKKGAFTDAAADAPGFFAGASGGTLFLDEIGVLPLELQPKLLRVLESREIFAVGAAAPRKSDARVVAATNVELRDEIAAGRFRRDLYARLAEHRIDVPPLRARRADIPLLCRHFLGQLAPGWRGEMSAQFLEALVVRDLPMNVRELRSLLQAVVFAHPGEEVLLRSHLPEEWRARSGAARAEPPPPPPSRDAPTRDELESLLRRYQGNVAKVAQHLDRTRMQIYRWLAKLGIDADTYRPQS